MKKALSNIPRREEFISLKTEKTKPFTDPNRLYVTLDKASNLSDNTGFIDRNN